MTNTSSTIPEFCARHSIAQTTFYRLAKQGRMPKTTRIGPRVTRILAGDEKNWLEQLQLREAS